MSDKCNCESSNKELKMLRETLLNLRKRFQIQVDVNSFVVDQFAMINDELEVLKQEVRFLKEELEEKNKKKKKK